MFANFTSVYEREAYISSPKFNYETEDEKVCMKFKYWIGDEDDKLQILALSNGKIISRDAHTLSSKKLKKWSTGMESYFSHMDQVEKKYLCFLVRKITQNNFLFLFFKK